MEADIRVYDVVDSTNIRVEELAKEGAAEGTCVVSFKQLQGQGRSGRSFFSPEGGNLYMSLLLRPKNEAACEHITVAAAVASAAAIEKYFDIHCGIKWVNDVFVNGKKTCGILTEASIDLESGGLDWAVMGIGFNVYEPEGGFPEEIRNIAGAVTGKRIRDLRSRMAASFLRHYYDIVETRQLKGYPDEYIKRSFVIGKRVNVLRSGASRPAKALSIDEECRLLVKYEDGTQEALSSGEVSIRPV